MSIETNYNGRRIVLSDDYLEHASKGFASSVVRKNANFIGRTINKTTKIANERVEAEKLAKKLKNDLINIIDDWIKNTKPEKRASVSEATISRYRNGYIAAIDKAAKAGDVEWLQGLEITKSKVDDDLYATPYRLRVPVYIKKSDRL